MVGYGYVLLLIGMTITNGLKLFHGGVNRDHYDKFIGIGEFSEKITVY